MIILFFGQPASGKTTLADAFVKKFEKDRELSNDGWDTFFRKSYPELCKIKYDNPLKIVRIDGDKWREVTDNKDYSKEGRVENLKSAFNMAKYLDREGFTPVLSFVCPYKELRDFLQNGHKCLFVYLHYLHMLEDRGRNNRFAKDFEIPQDCLNINTSLNNIDKSLEFVINEFLKLNDNTNEKTYCENHNV